MAASRKRSTVRKRARRRPTVTHPAAVPHRPVPASPSGNSPADDAPDLTRLTAALAASAGLTVTTRSSAGTRASTASRPHPGPADATGAGVGAGPGQAPGPQGPTSVQSRARAATIEAVPVGGCADNLAEGLEGDAIGLAATYWVDPDEHVHATASSATIRFVGRRVGAQGRDPNDHFDRTERVEGLPSGTGRISVTTRVVGINPGQWYITASPSPDAPARPAGSAGRTMFPTQRLTSRTRPTALLHGPGVHQAAWPILVLLGVLVALATQALLLLQRSSGHWGNGVGISLAAVVAGYLGAKIWYLVLHRQNLRKFARAGTCIQGFLLGGIGTLGLASVLTAIPAGLLLDATTPGVFLAMAIGRPGYLLGGCCAGRPTRSRWGLWSSDRRVGVRRVPVQLIEAATAAVIAAGALALFLSEPLPLPGALLVGALAVYTLARQVLFPLRGEPRRTTAGRPLALAVSALVAALAVVGSLLAA